MYVHSILLASVGFFNLENLTDNNDSISRWIDPRYQYNYSLPRIINSRYFARVNRNDKIRRMIFAPIALIFPPFSFFSSIFQRCHYFVPVYSKLVAKLGNKSGSSLSIEQSFILIVTPVRNGNNGRPWCR